MLFEVVVQDFQSLYLVFPELLDYIQSAYAIGQFQFPAVNVVVLFLYVVPYLESVVHFRYLIFQSDFKFYRSSTRS